MMTTTHRASGDFIVVPYLHAHELEGLAERVLAGDFLAVTAPMDHDPQSTWQASEPRAIVGLVAVDDQRLADAMNVAALLEAVESALSEIEDLRDHMAEDLADLARDAEDDDTIDAIRAMADALDDRAVAAAVQLREAL